MGPISYLLHLLQTTLTRPATSIQNDSGLPQKTGWSLRARLRCGKPAARVGRAYASLETTRVHHAARRRGAGIAASGDWAVSGGAIYDRRPLAGNLATGAAADGIVSTGAASAGFRRGQEHHHRAPPSPNGTAGASRPCRRARSPQGRRHHRIRRSCSARGAAGDADNPHRRDQRRYVRRRNHHLSRPGGNTTGLTILAPELSAKRLEVLQEMVPGMSRVAAFWDPTTGASQIATTENAARALKLKVQVLEIRRQEELLGAFQAAREGKAQAVNVFGSPFLASLYREIV